MATTLQKWQGVSQDFWQGASESDWIEEYFERSWTLPDVQKLEKSSKTWQDFNCLCGNKGSFWGGRGVNNQWTGAVRRGIIPSISGLISCAVSCLLLCAVFFCVLFSVFISCRLPRWTTWWTTPRSVPHCLHLAHPESSCFHLKAKQSQVSWVSTTILEADKGRWSELRPREIKCFVQKWHCDP